MKEKAKILKKFLFKNAKMLIVSGLPQFFKTGIIGKRLIILKVRKRKKLMMQMMK